MLNDLTKKFALSLFDIEAIKFGSFRLKLHEKYPDAPLSPIYIDLRLIRSYPEIMDIAVEIYQEMITDTFCDVLVDVPTAATPFVAVLSNKSRIPMISVRMKTKDHGTQKSIEGAFEQGQVALLIDDLITGADSKLKAISVLVNSEIKVSKVLVLIDREQGGILELKRRGYECISALKISDILELYRKNGKLSKNAYQEIITYLKKN
jgi:uridine monophosphate synthetase